MDVGGSPLPDCINPNNFPAKLWRLVNNPEYKAIGWDRDGECVVFDRYLLEKQVLSLRSSSPDNADAFKTTNFSSFVRQLNLYGFKKTDPVVKEENRGHGAVSHHYYNPNFKKNHPELVASMRRLTAHNKAKLQAGVDVPCRPRRQRLSWSRACINKSGKTESPSLHQESARPHQPKKAQAMAAHSGTPVPPRYLIRGPGVALSPDVFARDKGTPVPLSHHYVGVASSSNPVHPQQSLLAQTNYGNPSFPSVNPPGAPFLPGFYSSVYQCCQSNLLASHLASSGILIGPFSTQSYDQSGYPVNIHNQEPQVNEQQITTAMQGNAHVVKFKQLEEYVLSAPERMPEDAICEMTTDDANNTEVGDSPRDTSQAHNSSYTGSQPNPLVLWNM
ncbi:heat shock factor protein 5 isoform X2 [Acanthopagrus latus]|nr:heat shock factor protein 5 isoform X2 [Acanthopagrus latus]